MTHLKKFANKSAYELAKYKLDYPAVSLIQEDGSVVYDKENPPYLFAGLQIAPGPLYVSDGDASGMKMFSMYNDWNHDTYNDIVGDTQGSMYIARFSLGAAFSSQGDAFDESSDDIDNANTLNGWRVPTKAEWEKIITTDASVRPGSTVNGQANKHYAIIELSFLMRSGEIDEPYGLLIFPDYCDITGKVLSMDSSVETFGVTEEELNAYLAQGCAFLPNIGKFDPADDFAEGGLVGFYYAANAMEGECMYYLTVSPGDSPQTDYDSCGIEFPVRLVK